MDDGGLLNTGADLGDVFEVDSLNSEVVLFFFFLGDSDTFGSVDSLVHLEAQEVLDFNSLNKDRSTLPFSMMLTTMGK